MKRRLLRIMIIAISIACLLCGCVSTGSGDKSAKLTPNDAGDFKWREIAVDELPNAENCIIITGYVGESENVVVPKIINDRPVVAISEFAFSPLSKEDVILEDENSYDSYPDPILTMIENYKLNLDRDSFVSLSNSDMINVLNSHKHISKIKKVYLPDTIEYLLGYSFAYCDSLESVEIYGSDKDDIPLMKVDSNDSRYEAYPFFGCTNLKNVDIYFDVDRGCGTQYCYNFCINMEKAYIYPNEGGTACIYVEKEPSPYNFKEVHIADGCKEIYMRRDRKISSLDECTFYIPESVEKIDEHIFCKHTCISDNKGNEMPKKKENNDDCASSSYSDSDYYDSYDSEYEIIEEKETEPSFIPYDGECEISKKVKIVSSANSYAESYAKENGINFEAK